MKVLKLAASLAISFSAAAIGSLVTIPNIPTWYAALEKPFFNPPNWVFGPTWTILYIFIGISLYLVWIAETKDSKQKAYIIFGIQMTLNALWSLVFFGLHQLWPGLIVILALLISIALTIKYFWKFSRWASYLLVPYILWVSFAACLNLALALLN